MENLSVTYMLIPITTLEQVELLRQIRNDCRLFMTRSTNEISKEQQLDWYNLIDRNKMRLFLFYENYHGVSSPGPIGYGVVKIENNEVLLTGGLSSKQRNKGMGIVLFDMLVKESKKLNLPIKLEVLKTNERAKTIYDRLGFVTTGETDTVYEMIYNGE
jgi:ribosomal protein S18 acetylase RimI-like enzyme